MQDLARHFPENPILIPENIRPSRAGWSVESLLNPGVFEYAEKTWLLLRVVERAEPEPGKIGHVTLSRLRLVSSADGIHFSENPADPPLFGQGEWESRGIENCRVFHLGDTFHLAYTALSPDGPGIGLRSTPDWQKFTAPQTIFPHGWDCAFFEEQIKGRFLALQRPGQPLADGTGIWMAESPDLLHWDKQRCVATTRPGRWDSARIGPGAAPIRTPEGWLQIYYGIDAKNRHALGVLLLDSDEPHQVLARSEEPIMQPLATDEQTGPEGHILFTNGHIVRDDTVTIYYGAANRVVCAAHFSLSALLASLRK